MQEGMTEIIVAVITTGGVVLSSVGVAIFKGTRFLRNIRLDINELKLRLDDIASNLSLEDAIISIANEACHYVDKDDTELLKYFGACTDITLDFYKEIKNGGLSSKTIDDFDRASNKAVARAESAAGYFCEAYQQMFWPEFQNKAVAVNEDFKSILKDRFNRKEERIVIAIKKYMSDLYIHMINTRKEYRIKNKYRVIE